jgi:hypothetical protein
MSTHYPPGQTPGHWPTRGRWNPADLPPWYLELLADLAGDLTAWREHDPPQRLDPRCDPRLPRRRVERQGRHARG